MTWNEKEPRSLGLLPGSVGSFGFEFDGAIRRFEMVIENESDMLVTVMRVDTFPPTLRITKVVAK